MNGDHLTLREFTQKFTAWMSQGERSDNATICVIDSDGFVSDIVRIGMSPVGFAIFTQLREDEDEDEE